MKAFIQHLVNIPTQNTQAVNSETPEDPETFKMVLPDFSGTIQRSKLRRMCRLVKVGVHAATTCLQETDLTTVDAITIGTGLGGYDCFEKFESSIIRNEEETLSPTPFVQSLYNAVSGQIALDLQCYGYNMTYVHQGFSFESALLDALMLFDERAEVTRILVGGLDELTPFYARMLGRANRLKKGISEVAVEDTSSEGFVPGEGCTMMVLSDKKNKSTLAVIEAVAMLFKPNVAALAQEVNRLLAEHGIGLADIDAVLSGNCGDEQLDRTIQSLDRELFVEHRKIYFKNYCGEYQTASAFGVSLAVELLQESKDRSEEELPTPPLKYVLVVNHYSDINYSLILVSNV